MWWLNQAVGLVVKVFLLPFTGLNPWAGMIFISLLTAILMLFIYKKTSNQSGIKEAKNLIKGYLLEIRLFQNDFGIFLGGLKRLLSANLRYLAYNLKPLLVMILPIFLLLAQMNLWFGYNVPQPGETLLLKVEFNQAVEVDRLNLEVEAPAGVIVDSPPLRIIDENEVNWRLKIVELRGGQLVIKNGGQKYAKDISLPQSKLARVSAIRVNQNIWEQLLNPGEKPLPRDAEIKKIEVVYPSARLNLFGLKIHWLIAYFVLSIIFGFGLKGWFKVEI
ncbi:MAG TPA: hypothetical protein P5517_00355 [Candidatus Saccharicenans sp.]|jgi:uncharacterized membrane protein (DUF106 family)|nr:hypothetical protein [Candidatus Saccharicenans sp.]HPC87345.1 hypothetical protein [Candidatus Saccharicenans sp.]HQH60645.1 hypothetical protein [Candidatus Saccharicenans sp.]HQI22200.1 hypothetical protein [Candidatus Saccharicenans sp.]HRT25328.1 hypothetical protein [Candidatus Saccharicenans sp.]